VGLHRLEVRIAGRGSPAVVIDSGLGDTLDRLIPLQDRLAEATAVVTYNRAGYGSSEAGPLPRDSGREAEELKALLEGAGVAGPFVLVGHSLGGLNVQVFASRYPEDVAGIVLLDPPPLSFIRGEEYPGLVEMAERMTAEWQAIADSNARSSTPQEQTRAKFFEMIASEHREMFTESARMVSAISSFGDTPMLVMAAGRPNPAFGRIAGEYQEYWIRQSRMLTKRSPSATFVLAEDSSHHLYEDAPNLVVDGILSVVSKARTPN